ncbi:efflux RND transporter periplasmic adaptor subunit [Rhodopila sp.]|uniref:efflux RND transporter periplasmic adaptor subunit n=1 Tax=Rhodopila sp. TaxID=2480087 RepID=UPI003D0C70C5
MIDQGRRGLQAKLALFGGLLLAAVTATPACAQPSAVPVSVAKAVQQDVPIWLRGLGTVQPNYGVQLRPRVDGTLTQVPIAEGQDVKKGDLLAVIDPRPYQAMLDTAMAKKQQDQAQLANAQADFARYASLVKQDFASHQQLDTQQAMVKQFTASILGDEAQIESAQLNLSFCYITAPFAGRIGLRNVDPGSVVHSGEMTPLISVMQVQPIALTFTLPQDTLPAITKAMGKHPLEVVAYASDDKTELDRGTLLTIDNMIDVSTGTIKVKATFPNASHSLWPGQFVRARLLIGTDAQVVTVPSVAVQHGPDGLYVYQIGPDKTVSVQPVTVTREEDDVSVISRGLAAGAVVVVAGQSRLQAGSKVAIREDASSPVKSGS